MREAFEASILDKPDDSAGYAAYADWLQEQGDPRGEFIAVQLALEDESRPAPERKALQERERELLAEHEREWLGELAPYLVDGAPNYRERGGHNPELPDRPATEYQWRKGFLARLKTECLTVPLTHALADTPASRFLQQLHVISPASYLGIENATTPHRISIPQEHRYCPELIELIGAPLLQNLRVFQMGDYYGEPPEDGWCDNHTEAWGIHRLIAEMKRVVELHLLCKEYDAGALFALPNLANLRVLRMYALGEPYADEDEYEIPLDILAQNPVLRNLTHLMLHTHGHGERSFIPLGRVAPVFHSPHLKSLVHLQLRLSDMGDDGVREIINSGILKRLKWLDLRHGCITDAGARLLARCRDARNLDRLDLSRNAVTPAGLAELRKAKINAVANNPLTDQELADQQYLREGDFE